MHTIHLFEEGYYLIGNRSVATSPMFNDQHDVDKLSQKIDCHLSSLCDIMAYGFQREEFQLVIRIKSREEVISYFKDRYPKFYEEHREVPPTTYIFAQAMANLQSGYVKSFNFRNRRDGGLMAGRYSRQLIESEEELNGIIDFVHSLNPLRFREARWAYKQDANLGKNGKLWESLSSRVIYAREKGDFGKPNWFKMKCDIYLRGQFDNPPPKRINDQNQDEKMKNMLYFIFLRKE